MQRGSGEQALTAAALTIKQNNKLANVGDRPRDQGEGNSMKAAVASLSARLSADPTQISCGDSSRLSWSSTEAARAEISGVGEVDASGEQLVKPIGTTSYELTATGPGGLQSASAIVNVDSAIEASLSVSPGEIRYRKIGDKVVEHGTAEVVWSTTNADRVTIESTREPAEDEVPASGTRTVQPAPEQTDIGPVDETVTGTLTATNNCGGSESRTAALRITGSIEALPEVVLASIFFPTDYPDQRNPGLGLLRSQQQTLSSLADGFKGYLEYDPDAHLVLEAHADQRSTRPYNQTLSERRAARVKQFLVDQGIASASIETTGLGEGQNLERSTVRALEEQNPNDPPRRRVRARYTDWLAHNRRVDVVLRPAGETSTRYYPHNADDSRILWQQPKPSRRRIEEAQ
jgi:outer membrane protein OmpA-like peptidoglycan-associated protein